MAIQSTRGTEFHVEKTGVAGVTPTITDITKAKPAVVTVSDATGLEDDAPIVITGSDFGTVDGQVYIIANLSGTTFELLGSDTSGESATFNSGTVAAKALAAADLQLLKPSGFEVTPGSQEEIDIATFVDPEATLPGNTPAGSYTLSGFMDTTDIGYQELLLAREDGAKRVLRVKVAGQKFMTAEIYIGTNTPGIPISGAPTFQFSGTFASRIRHRF